MTAGPAYALRRLPPWATGAGLTVVQAALVGKVSGFVPCAGYLPAHAVSLNDETAGHASLQPKSSAAMLWSLSVPSTAFSTHVRSANA